MRDFDFLEPTTVTQASRMLADLGPECRVMAGGTALMLVMRQRMLNPSHIISVARLPELQGLRVDAQGTLHIGALCRHADLARHPLVRQHQPVLAEMAAQVANPQVRNQGTLGGNLCYGDPSTDPPTCLMALDAQVVLATTRGQRVLAMHEFLVDYFATAIESDEIVTEVRVPPLSPAARARYSRFKRTAAEHRPLVSVAAVIEMQGSTCQRARLVVGASVAVPQSVREAEDYLCGRSLDETTIAETADRVAGAIEPISDLRGGARYRRDMVRVQVRRTLHDIAAQPRAKEPA